jgi:hypothetical protein
MTLVLVVHHPDAEAEAAAEMRSALRDAIWEVADAHWALGGDTVLAATDLSPDYLMGHFRRAIARRGHKEPGQLLVVPFAPRSAFIGLPAEAESWVRDQLD